jgi:hypothetical protein
MKKLPVLFLSDSNTSAAISREVLTVMSFAKKLVFNISFEDYVSARLQMEECHAFDDPADDRKLLMPRNL